MMKKNVKLVSAVALTMAFSACTKERPDEMLLKEDVLSKAQIDTQSEYLYLPSVVNTPRDVSHSRPHWMGRAKVVKFRFTETSLDVVQVEQDPRFTENNVNAKPVISIPVTHVDYRMVENAAGEKTNKEMVEDRKTWAEKRMFKPNFSALNVQDVNIIPIEIDNFFSPCYSETASHFVGYTLENDALNIEVEKTFKAGAKCLSDSDFRNEEDIDKIGFTVRHAYSLVKLDSVASPNYQPVLYPKTDENTFGFFTTEQHTLSEDNRPEVKGSKVLMNRWDPNRSEITYYLTDNFNKPEHAKVKKATLQAVQAVNKAFAEAGTKLRIVTQDGNGKKPSDIRNSMIVMVEDPMDSGLLGYGPSVANPKTGELVSGRVVMYLGNIKQYVREAYEEILEEKANAEAAAAAAAAAAGNGGNGPATPVPAPAEDDSSGEIFRVGNLAKLGATSKKISDSAQVKQFIKAAQRIEASRPVNGSITSSPVLMNNLTKRVKAAVADVKHYHKHSVDISDKSLKEKIELLSRHNVYPAELFNFEGAVGAGLAEEFKGVELKPWAELAKGEKEQILDALLPHVWLPTLIHEIGHTLGLRHNFQGSEDASNFYKDEELAKEGITGKIPYSSVMDYGYRDLNQLKLMGKYDIAALRYAYARKVQDANGVLLPIDTTLADLTANPNVQLKEYGFCTDEHVGINAGCRRFDEGTNYTEIAMNLVESYEKNYKKRNFRNGRRNFSMTDDATYAARVSSTFRGMRVFFEVYERIQSQFDLPAEVWASNEFLKDLDKAVDISMAFFLNVLRTPDLSCAVAKANDPEEKIAGVAPIKVFGGGMSCFDAEVQGNLNPQFKIVGQLGKSFEHFKSPNNDNSYINEIDVRGIWIDKLMAAKYLFYRKLGSKNFDDVTYTYIENRGQKAAAIIQTIDQILSDQLQGQVVVDMYDGSKKPLNLTYGLSETHEILESLSPGVARFGLPTSKTHFHSELVRDILIGLKDKNTSELADTVTSFYKISTADTMPSGFALNEFLTLDIGSTRYMARPENANAIEYFQLIAANRLMGSVEEERLLELGLYALEQEMNPPADGAAPAPAPAPAEGPKPPQNDAEKAIVKLGPEVILAFLEGELPTEAYLTKVLQNMQLGNLAAKKVSSTVDEE